MKIRKGFTLVELLVVISIIALLLAILMPTLSSAREQGRTIVCGTHMKELAVSWMVYAMNNNDKLCGAFTYNNNYSNWGHKWDWVWAPWRKNLNMAVPIGGKCTLEEKKEGIMRGALYKYNIKVEIYKCPSDRAVTEHLCSFSMPDCLAGMEFERNGARAKWSTLTKLPQVKAPSSKYVFLEENDSRTYNCDSWEGPDGEPSSPKYMTWRDSVIWWHRGSSNLAFADGHSIKRKWSRETKEQFTANNGGGWMPRTPEGIGDLKYMIAGWAK